MLITGSVDSIIKIYDENEPEESVLLKVIIGGHEDGEITAMAYSPLLALLASGSSNSIISIWDIELAKLDEVCYGHTSEITAMEFLDPYPVLVSASNDGSVILWGVRPCVVKYRYKPIVRIFNMIVENE